MKTVPAAAIAAILATGFAGPALAAPAGKFPLPKPGDALSVSVRSDTANVALREDEARRLADAIERCFVRTAGAATAGHDSYVLDVDIVAYSTGYDYIRAMLPYVSARRVDAIVHVRRTADGPELAQLAVTSRLKTATLNSTAVSVDDLEDVLADSVAASLHEASDRVAVASDRAEVAKDGEPATAQ